MELNDALCISFDSSLRTLSVKIIWQNTMLAMEQQERFQGKGRQSVGVSRSWCLSVLCPSPYPGSCPTPLRLPICSVLTLLPQIPMCFGHEVWRWRRGNGSVIAGLGVQGNFKARKQMRAAGGSGKACWEQRLQHLYPNLMSPRPVLALCSSLPCCCSLCLECPCHLKYSYCPLHPSSNITWNPHINQLLLCTILF